MSSVTVGNIHFESTANSRISYSANSITMSVGGANVFTANSTQFSILVTANATPSIQTTTGTITANTISINSNGNIQVYGQYVLNGTVTPAVINSNTTAWAPGITNTSIIRFSGNSSVTLPISIYGMTAGTNGQVVVLSNIGTKLVRISNEDALETTASNRFSLPQEILLNGYQSMSVYYDGTDARWKPLDLSYTSFWKNFLTKAFFAGGTTTAPVVVLTADRTTYSTETTAAVPGANLSQARLGSAGAGNACKAFISGGSDGAAVPATVYLATANRTTYVTEATAAVTGANLSAARRYVGGAGNICKGFFIGGGAAGASAVADRTTYSTETTAAVTSANLPVARNRVSAVGNSCKSFNSGGEGPSAVSDRTIYATETTAAVPGANLTQARDHTGSAGNSIKGFFVGGRSPTLVATADRTTYATETTAAVPGANISAARSSFSGAGNSCKGFFGGGINPLAIATADRTTYSTETTAAVPGANLSQARSLLAAI